MNTWTPNKVPSGKVKETAGMGGDKMMVDIDAFLVASEQDEGGQQPKTTEPTVPQSDSNQVDSSVPSPRVARKTTDLNNQNPDRHVSVDLGAFLDDLKEANDPTSIMKGGNGQNQGIKKTMSQRHPRVSIAGVTDVQEAPKLQHHHHHKGKGRKRDPVTETQAKEAVRHMKELRENQGLNGLITFLKKNAAIGPNDEVKNTPHFSFLLYSHISVFCF